MSVWIATSESCFPADVEVHCDPFSHRPFEHDLRDSAASLLRFSGDKARLAAQPQAEPCLGGFRTPDPVGWLAGLDWSSEIAYRSEDDS